MQQDILFSILNKLKALSASMINHQAMVGVDGYVDYIQRPVKNQTAKGPDFFDTIEDFSNHTALAAGKSAQIELHTQENKLGGNAPIMANALGALGISTICVGNFGYPDLHEIFKGMHKNVSMHSVGNPAVTNALEFEDGKLILSEVGPFKQQDWKHMTDIIPANQWVEMTKECQLIALVDWCNLPHSTNIWKGILENVLPNASAGNKQFFFDIADPTRRSDHEISEALNIISSFGNFGKVTLGLNENEAEKLYSCIQRIHRDNDNETELNKKAAYIFDKLSISSLLVHPLNRSIMVTEHQIQELKGRVVEKPKISTGGGDNFNAGFCFAQLNGFNEQESMVLAMANSGAYVQNGMSTTLLELSQYIENWLNETK